MDINDRIQHIINELFDGNRRRFSKAVDINPATIQNIVGERRVEPSTKILQKIIANIEGLNSSWLMSGVGEMLLDINYPPPNINVDRLHEPNDAFLSIIQNQQETIKNLTEQLRLSGELIKEKQNIIDDFRHQLKLRNAELRFSKKQTSSSSAAGGKEGRQAG